MNLYGSSDDNEVKNADLTDSIMNVLTLIPKCVPDYLTYKDSKNTCSDDSHFMDVIY